MTRRVVALRNVQSERDDAYRAIGRYTVQFSVLVAICAKSLWAISLASAGILPRD